ncbi:GGDEF domain-containing protein [Candidatus Poriferisodalis sp.]|uniref:GGDEF domain-containing protein n=1 Tax=Candidatus Poriferisodalis sp. TaxID=3101277 RepID=UPI003B011A66
MNWFAATVLATAASAFVSGVWWSSIRRRSGIRPMARDPLTGTANRTWVLRYLRSELARAARSGRVVGVAFCDIDAFKEVNDGHGHLAGDLVLVAVAQHLRSALRPADVVARFGGDEFIVVCGGLDSCDDMAAIGDRLRKAASDLSLSHNAHLSDGVIRVTTSIGTATGRGGEVTPEDLIASADRSMYRHKRLLDRSAVNVS